MKKKLLQKIAGMAVGLLMPLAAFADVEINEINFPDANFRAWLLEQDYGADGVLTEAEIIETTSIIIEHKNIVSLKGIEYFTALTFLGCDYNQLTTLDVSNNTALTVLNCDYNQLTMLDMSNNPILKDLWCQANQIKDAAMTALMTSLPLNTTGETCKIYVNILGDESNVCTQIQAMIAKAKGWTPMYCNENGWVEYEGSDEEVPEDVLLINEENFPDEGFRRYLLQQDYGKDGILTKEEIDGITSFHTSVLWTGSISSLKGIEYLTALKTIGGQFPKLTSLDLSKNMELTDIFCSGVPLTTLDVSNHTALESLRVWITHLTSVDVSGCTALTELNVSAAYITSLDVSSCTALTALYCSNNQIRGEAMDALINSLPQNTTGELHEFRVFNDYDSNLGVLDIYYEEGNVCTKAQVAAAKAKGWTPMCLSENGWVEYEGSDEETTGIKYVGTTDSGHVPVYNLAGQKMADDRLNAKKGVYIVGGKKVIIK